MSFQPVEVLGLDEASCSLARSKVDDSGNGPPSRTSSVKLVPGCSAAIDQFIAAARGGGRRLPSEGGLVNVDGTEWVAEWADERGHSFEEVHEPVIEPSPRQGAAAACQGLLDAWDSGDSLPGSDGG